MVSGRAVAEAVLPHRAPLPHQVPRVDQRHRERQERRRWRRALS